MVYNKKYNGNKTKINEVKLLNLGGIILVQKTGKRKREMTGAELKSMLKSSIHFKSLGGVTSPGLRLTEDDLAWWRDAKFGLFIHWGLYSILGRGEWVMHNENIPAEEYAKLADKFAPKHFNADTWASIAKRAGTKYMVMVARHHDGFALWDSPGSYGSFTSVKTAAKRDFIKEYVEACRRANLKVGIYYSLMDWRFPGYFKPKELPDNALLMKKQCYDQMEELVSKYGKIDIVWYDGGWLAHKGSDPDAAWLWEPVKLNEMVRKYNPKTIINPRSGWEGDFYCDEGPHEINGKIIPVPWEKNFSIGSAWGWVKDDEIMPYEEVLYLMINVFVRDGNVLVNVGPDAEGVIPQEMVDVLESIGQWMKKYGESIYGTRGGPFQPVDKVYGSTYKGNTIYLHVFDNDEFEKLKLPPVNGKILKCEVLGAGRIEYRQDSAGISLQIPPQYREAVDTVVKMEMDLLVEFNNDEEIVITGK